MSLLRLPYKGVRFLGLTRSYGAYASACFCKACSNSWVVSFGLSFEAQSRSGRSLLQSGKRIAFALHLFEMEILLVLVCLLPC